MGRKKAEPRPARPALVAHTQRDILVQVATTLQHASDSLRMMQETQANMLAATRVLAEQVDDCQSSVDRLDGSVRTMSENVATLGAKLGMSMLSNAEHVAHQDSQLSPLPPSLTDTPAEASRRRRLARLTDWYMGLGLTVKIVGTVVVLLPALGSLIYGAWKMLAWLAPDQFHPPTNPPTFMGPPRGPK